MVVSRLGLFLLSVVALVCIEAKPYWKEKNHRVKAKFFRDDFGVPPVVPSNHFDKKHYTHHEEKEKLIDWPTEKLPEEKPKAPEPKKIKQKLEDPCQNIYCHYGRVCKANDDGKGSCVCAGPDYCQGHKKRVCGTDGVFYQSHCELHRIACVKMHHIGIDHSGKSCTPPPSKKESMKKLPEVVKDDLDKEEDEKKDIKDKKDKSLEKEDKETKKTVDTKPIDEKPEFPKSPVVPDPDSIGQQLILDSACTELEYERLKNNLLQYHCVRIGDTDCNGTPEKKQFLANIMFSYYDRNNNQLLDESELSDIEHRDHLERLSRLCGLADMLTFDDLQEDGNITVSEFFAAFKIPTVILDESLKVFTTVLTLGNSIELKCDIKGATHIEWNRNGATLDDITTDDIKVFQDGSLYINDLGLHHTGNYSCRDKFNENVIQIHILKVQMPPLVKVSPPTQFHTTGSSVTLQCHVDGIPVPDILWEMNELPLPEDPEGKHYLMQDNNATLEIKTATYTKDTGAYKCKAQNAAGTSQDIATVFIENSDVPTYSEAETLDEAFVVFHDKGYTVYEPSHCQIEHQVSGSFNHIRIMPQVGDTLATLCEDGEACSWGDAVNVKHKFIYITQPKLNRVIVMEIREKANPIEVIVTDKVPVSIRYIEHLDQVWVLCWNQKDDTGSKTAVVIRDASDDSQHHTVHTQPMANGFDLVKDIFLPPNNDLEHKYKYGYVTHGDQMSLYKLDLAAMKYVKSIDLTDYDCIPKSAAFLPLGGQVMVHCAPREPTSSKTTRLMLDYVTDKVMEHISLGGEPYISPDAQYLVLIQDGGAPISVHKIHENGKLEHLFDEYTNFHISDVTFFPSERGRGYDFYATSANKNDVIYINLASGKVEMIEGVGQAMREDEWPWNKHNRIIVSGGVFGQFLMTPARDSVVLIDGKRRHVQCEWQGIVHGNVIVWVNTMQQL